MRRAGDRAAPERYCSKSCVSLPSNVIPALEPRFGKQSKLTGISFLDSEATANIHLTAAEGKGHWGFERWVLPRNTEGVILVLLTIPKSEPPLPIRYGLPPRLFERTCHNGQWWPNAQDSHTSWRSSPMIFKFPSTTNGRFCFSRCSCVASAPTG